ncbi:MAG: tetratricopeptide repeat protein [Actinomycetia bacterium]|nr:tetratricopeptide repeat protein [Actinomycetes bacterium]
MVQSGRGRCRNTTYPCIFESYPGSQKQYRPFPRCMHGYGLCLWRLGRFDEAERVFNRMLWLNPTDNQGVRFLFTDVKAGKACEDHRDEW